MLTLGIETAIAGGSLCLARDGKPVATWNGGAESARAELLLVHIDELLRKGGLQAHDLNSIVVGIGPGSFTGIRIGISTALGLGRAIGLTCRGVMTLDALNEHLGDGPRIVAVPLGRAKYCWKSYGGEQAAVARAGTIEDLCVETVESGVSLAAHPAVGRAMDEIHGELRPQGVTNTGYDLAVAIACASALIETTLEPLYLTAHTQQGAS